jgi:ribosomal protein S12 methylthiotransferase accessory factor YcaO
MTTKTYADNLTKSETGSTVTRASKWTAEDGTVFFDIRKFYKNKGSDEFKPGKGISLPMDVAVLDALIEAAQAARVDAAAMTKKTPKVDKTADKKTPKADKTADKKTPKADKTADKKTPKADKTADSAKPESTLKCVGSTKNVRVGIKRVGSSNK